MNKKMIVGFTALCAAGFATWGWAGEGAPPDEIKAKVNEAAAALAGKGEAGLAEFNKKDTQWVWKDTYVFVYDCDKNVMSAHPINPKLAGKKLDEIKDKKDNAFFADLCAAGKKPEGGWVEYWWSKPGAEGIFRKISYAIQAGDGPYQVGAGVYDDKLTVEELDKMK